MLEDWNNPPICVLEILVNIEKEHEGNKETSSREEVPEIMTVIEVEESALQVGTSWDWRRFVNIVWFLWDEEVWRRKYDDERPNQVDYAGSGEVLLVHQLHGDVVGGVDEQVSHDQDQDVLRSVGGIYNCKGNEEEEGVANIVQENDEDSNESDFNRSNLTVLIW